MHRILPIIIFYFICVKVVYAQVPAQWDTAKIQLTNKLKQINTQVLNRWDNQPYCTNFGGNLIIANSNKGYKLFTPDPANFPSPVIAYQNAIYAKIDTLLMAFDTLGLSSVDVTIQYPLLVNSFPHSQDYLHFFKTVCRKVKEKGFKLIIGTQAAFIDTVFGETNMVRDIKNHYFNPDNNATTDDTLENNRFRQEKSQMMQTVIDSLNPDYLIMEMEPQTQVNNLFGLVDYSVESTISHINYFLQILNRKTTLLGAGAGSWDNIEFIHDIARTEIDFIDYHVYPPHFNYIDNNAFIIDSIADANNKKLIIGEAWCYKSTNYEMSATADPVGTSAMIYARDGFDFWTSIDTLFIKSMIALSQQSKIDVVSFFWVNNFFGQLTWDNVIHGSMTPSQLLTSGQQVGLANMYQFHISPIGVFLKEEIASICSPSTVVSTHNDSKIIGVYPNPAENNSCELRYPMELSNHIIFLYDLLGRLIFTVVPQSASERTTLNLHRLSNGIYLVRMGNERLQLIKN